MCSRESKNTSIEEHDSPHVRAAKQGSRAALDPGHTLFEPEAGDLLVDEKYLFEIGGRNKQYNQIADIPDSYVIVDDMETGVGNKIPMWLFGFLY